MKGVSAIATFSLITFAVACRTGGSELPPTATNTTGATFEPTVLKTLFPTVEPTPSPRPTGTQAPAVQATPWSTLRSADSQVPTAGICAGPTEGDTTTITRQVDVAVPRCLYVIAAQRLQYTNATDEGLRVQLGPFDLTMPAGEARLLDAPVGTYLDLGVHRISAFDPGGREIGGGEVLLFKTPP